MLYSKKNVEDLQNLNKLESLQDQVQEVRLQYKLSEEKYHQKGINYLNHLLNHSKNHLNI